MAPRRRSRIRILPLLLTLIAIVVAVILGRAMWNVYMAAPWTRDGTVRAYVVTIAPQIAGEIVDLPVADNQFVHKGDLLMVIDPTNYKIAVSLAAAAVQQALANAENTAREARRREALTTLSTTVEEKQTFESNAVAAQASYQQAVANLDQARVNLQRTEIRSPVNGYVTNLLVQLGDYATVGQNIISLVDADSFWVDGYFEETNLDAIRAGDPATDQADGLPAAHSRPCRQRRPRDQRRQCAAGHPGPGLGQPDLHLGAPGAAGAGADPYRRCPDRRHPGRGNHRHRADRSPALSAVRGAGSGSRDQGFDRVRASRAS